MFFSLVIKTTKSASEQIFDMNQAAHSNMHTTKMKINVDMPKRFLVNVKILNLISLKINKLQFKNKIKV